ncbi:hypothetical protein ABES01_09715 [Paenibacillus rhizolycopersici]|uniref:hypothetical protein n=1 Tax=Paenibacillus rhizolycopersici TaxID=2780073 RepID=UPI003D2821E0
MEVVAKPKLGSGERFKQLTKKIQKEGYDRAAAQAVAASIGRKKYGAKKMASMAAKGRKSGRGK